MKQNILPVVLVSYVCLDNIDQFIEELEAYIDYYNNKRIKSKLKGMSSVQYRIHSSKAA